MTNDDRVPHRTVSDGVSPATLVRKIEALQTALEASESARRELLHSTSWRITAPIRWLRRALRGERHPGPPKKSAYSMAGVGLDAFPATLRAVHGDRPDGANDTYHPLDLDDALRSVVPTPAKLENFRDEDTSPSGLADADEDALRIAFLGSEELGNEIAYDAAVTQLMYETWREQLNSFRFDFVLIETAWLPPGGWQYGLLGVGESGSAVRNLIDTARNVGLPVVLWVRESPENLVRYRHVIDLVDIVYAIDERVAGQLRRDHPDATVHLLPPAIQPLLHNPVRSYRLRDAAPRLDKKVLLDGWWDLSAGVNRGFDIGDLKSKLLVTESEWDVSRVRIDDLPEFKEFAIGCVTPIEKTALSRIVPVELFPRASLLPDWRRSLMMRRAAACGALVVHIGAQPAVPGGMEISAEESQAADLIRSLLDNPLERARRAHLAFREVISEHCMADRLATIASHLGLGQRKQVIESAGKVAVILVTMRPERLDRCLAWFRNERYPDRELIVLLHGRADFGATKRLVRPGEPIRILQLGRERSLGDCLNFALAHTDAPYWIKMDDDDHYGPNYLWDVMLYRRVSRAPMFGKPPVFLHLEEGDELRWDPVWSQHANLLHAADEAVSALVAGGTLGGRREVLDDVQFSARRRGGSDSDFVRRCYDRGYDVLATDGFNFARFRSHVEGFHTWQAPAAELKERAKVVGSGAELEKRVFI